MWVFKKDQKVKTDKIMNKLYPEIYNLIIKVDNEPVVRVVKNTTEDPVSKRVKKEEPLPSGFFNF
jgi:hypothetical protein